MTALQKALAMLGAEEFGALQRKYTLIGYTYTSPDAIAFARTCQEVNPFKVLQEGEPADAWWVELVIGKGALALLCGKLPYNLPRIGWQRGFNNRPEARFYDTQALLTKI